MLRKDKPWIVQYTYTKCSCVKKIMTSRPDDQDKTIDGWCSGKCQWSSPESIAAAEERERERIEAGLPFGYGMFLMERATGSVGQPYFDEEG